MLLTFLVILLIVGLFSGGYGSGHGWGYYGWSPMGLLIVLVILALLFGWF